MKFPFRQRAPHFPPIRPAALFLALCLVAPASVSHADEDGDHELAREALEHMNAMPLADILAKVRPKLPGKIIGIEFDEDGGRYVYEFKVLDKKGQLVEAYVDALTGKILKIEDD
jgi:uncharacterized membrane protein YkoI